MSDSQSPPEQGTASKTAAMLEPSDYNEFLLRAKSEIVFVLRSLVEHVSQVTVFFNEGKDMLLTTVVAVEEDALVLDYGASSEINRKVVEAQKLFCVTSLEKVKIQFILRGIKRIDYEGRPAFRAPLPEDVLRLQRREYYRLTMPVTRPLRCRIPITKPDGSTETLEADVVDISGGGVAMIAPPVGMVLESGMEFPNCHIDLPEIGTAAVTLQVRSVFEVTLRSGARLTRSGCQFVKIPGPTATLIQRYIIKVERERKARESGMA